MTLNDPLAGFFYDFVSIEALLKGLDKFDDPQLIALIKERCNVDLALPKARYPARDMFDMLKIIHQTVFPQLNDREAMVEMGRATARGFTRTVLGKILNAPMKLLTPERAVHQMVRMYNASLKFGKRVLLKQGEQDYILQFLDDPGHPAFAEGIIKYFFESFNLTQVKIEGRQLQPLAYEVRFSW